MNTLKSKTQLAENRYWNKLGKDIKEVRLNTEKHKKQSNKFRKIKEDYKMYNHQLKKQKRQQNY